MRVIAGKYKGHSLVSFSDRHIRPTTDRVKETLFNIIQFDIEGRTFLDLFSGTGNLGIEAISRGAEKVIFVEKSTKSIVIIKKNLEKLKVDPNQYQIIHQDVFEFLKKYEGSPFDLVVADPPFPEKWPDEILKTVSQSAVLGTHSSFIIESRRDDFLEKKYDHLSLYNYREFGDKVLSFFKAMG